MVDFGVDQAAGLRRMSSTPPVKVIAITGGKGGVGKSSVAINLGTALSLAGRRVMLLDADLGLANVDVLLGLRAEFNLEHVIEGRCELKDVIVTANSGLRVVPASSGSFSMATLARTGQVGLIYAFSELFQPLDYLLIDTAAGLSESVMTFSEAAHRVIVVVCDEPASLTDAYGLVKVLSRRQPDTQIEVVTNMTESAAHGQSLFEKLARVGEKFLGVTPRYLGNIPSDQRLRRAVQQQMSVVEAFPGATSTRAFKDLAQSVDRWKPADKIRGGVEFFVERLIDIDSRNVEGTLQ